MDTFREALEDYGLHDLGFKGNFFYMGMRGG